MHRGRIHQLQMWIKMQHSMFKISNNEENIINPAISYACGLTPRLLRRVDRKDRRLAGLIMVSSLLLILNTQYCILIPI